MVLCESLSLLGSTSWMRADSLTASDIGDLDGTGCCLIRVRPSKQQPPSGFHLFGKDGHEIRDQLVRAPAGLAHGVRECPEADPRGLWSMEGAGQLQDRLLCDPSRRV